MKMIKFSEQMPPRDPAYQRLSVPLEMMLDNGLMAAGFIRFDDTGFQAYEERDDRSGCQKCTAVSWRLKNGGCVK